MSGAGLCLPSIRLLLADIDGTLATSEKELAPSSSRAARELKRSGIALAVTSSRPPRGMLHFIEGLEVETPTGAFNGGAFVEPDLTILAQSPLPAGVAKSVASQIRDQGLDVWVYSAEHWYVQDLEGPHVARERRTLRFDPTVVDTYDPVIDRVVKIVGVTDDPALMARAEDAVRQRFGATVSASLSQAYYLDVTHPDANKGNVVGWLSAFLDIPRENIATIGDGPNDVLMFRRSGLSIAMGNAKPEVKAEAMLVTSSNDEDGFAHAVEDYVLPRGNKGG
jgi:Cof subfamily protein (haloacid dehalogenase superfamily)